MHECPELYNREVRTQHGLDVACQYSYDTGGGEYLCVCCIGDTPPTWCPVELAELSRTDLGKRNAPLW